MWTTRRYEQQALRHPAPGQEVKDEGQAVKAAGRAVKDDHRTVKVKAREAMVEDQANGMQNDLVGAVVVVSSSDLLS